MEGVDFGPNTIDSFGTGAEGPSVKVVNINGKSFVSGLYWKPLKNYRKYMHEAREFGKERGWDIVAIRKGVLNEESKGVQRIQAGFVGKNDGALKGMYSLAASLAGILGDKWIGAFDVGNGYYAVIAVTEGSIVPGYDVICRAEEARNLLVDGDSLFTFDKNHSYAPATFKWAMQELDLRQVLTPSALRKEYRLRPLQWGFTTRELVSIGVACGVMAGAAYGVMHYLKMREIAEQIEAAKQAAIRRAELERINAMSKKKQEETALVHPWVSQPAALDFVQHCRETYRKVALSVAGWGYSGAECGQKAQTVKFTYKRPDDGQTVRAFADRVKDLYDVEASFPDDDTANFSLPLQVPFGGDDALVAMKDLVLDFRSHFQGRGIKVAILEDKVDLPATAPALQGQVTQAQAQPVVVPTWKHGTFSYETTAQPAGDFVSLASLPGVRVTKVVMSTSPDGEAAVKWAISGDLYGK